ncbi:MAG: RagB/SusD family nutrient uptake outer membrane protein [Bacteroidetes bacterium]|nr:RagB/SusD family nutrient uptake outer membrane protein [Bacteroidota bacterium]
MKYIIAFLFLSLFFGTACTDLNINPLSQGSSASWYSNETEFTMALNDCYREVFWPKDDDLWTDDVIYRANLNEITGNTMTGQSGTVTTMWLNSYKSISRCNTIIASIPKATGKISTAKLDQYAAEARFCRACRYSDLIRHFGDVIYTTRVLPLDSAFMVSKTPKADILKGIYADLDFAASKLPASYSASTVKRATKGAALAYKARIALCMGDYTTARDAAKACMDLGVYTLYPDFGKLFLPTTKNAVETIFMTPRSVALNVILDVAFIQNTTTRTAPNGWCAYNPSWDFFCSFLCTDGKTIDKSPLYNPRLPFKNRDPRCTKTIVEFGTAHLGFIYQPHPDSTKVLNVNTGKYVTNMDTRSYTQYASYNGLACKKGVDIDWIDDLKSDPDRILMRYADVLLMYAEAKIELNEIDQTVRDAMNMVRARAYGVDKSAISSYPAITETDQASLRRILRLERRMEFYNEGLRYQDIIRWKIAEIVLNKTSYGMLDPADQRAKIISKGLWFFPGIPNFDNQDIPDFTAWYTAGLTKLLTPKTFDKNRQYLWPLPTTELLGNKNLAQNPGY